MRRPGELSGSRGNFLLSAVGIAALTVPLAFTFANPAQSEARAQSQAATATASAFGFDVVSIKPSKSSGPARGRLSNAPDGITAKTITVQELIQRAYGIPPGTNDGRIAGGPAWLTTERFDIDARMDAAAIEALQKLKPDESRIARLHMLQALLADYFKLAFIREMKPLQRYTLSVAKGGAKLQEATPEEIAANNARIAAGRFAAELMKTVSGGEAYKSFSMTQFAQILSQLLERPVVDQTGLTGLYDFTFIWAPEIGLASAPTPGVAANQQTVLPSADDDDSNVIAGIQKLGLKLESGKGPVEVIVVTHVERPAEN